MSSMSTSARPPRFDAALLLLRLGVGTIFFAHGWQKLFVYGLSGATGAFQGMGIPLPALSAPLVAGLELFGGLALLLGLLTRLAGVGLALVMAGAILFVHFRAGFFAPEGVEFPLVLFATAGALALSGAGRFSLDAWLGQRGAARA